MLNMDEGTIVRETNETQLQKYISNYFIERKKT